MNGLRLLKSPFFWLFLMAIFGVSLIKGVSLGGSGLRLTFCDVGEGDASLVSYRQTQVLIDGGPGNKVLECLSHTMPFWDRTIEMVVLTHPQADHLNGLIDVIERYNVRQFVINSLMVDAAVFEEFHQQVVQEKSKLFFPKKGDRLLVGPLMMTVLWPPEQIGDAQVWLGFPFNREQLAGPSDKRQAKPESSLFGGKSVFAPLVLGVKAFGGDLNETAIVLRLEFQKSCALFTSDISKEIESQLQGDDNCQILKVAHHGSRYSTGEDFLKKVNPSLAVISVGKNQFGHPTDEVLGRLDEQGITYLRTDTDGEVNLVSDGNRWKISN